MKQRADGRWRKTKKINNKNVYFYSSAKTERAALRDIERQMLKYTEELTKKKMHFMMKGLMILFLGL